MNLTEQLRKRYPAGVAYTVPEATQTLPEVLFATAERYPNRIALDFLGATMTYAQLARKVRQAARVFTRSGVRRNDRVGITLPNCPQHVIAVFGALTIGAIVVETNPLAPKAELSRQLRDAGCDVLVIWENSLKSIDIESVAPHHVFTVNLTKALPFGPRMLINLPIAAAKRKRAQMSAKTPSWTKDFDATVNNVVPLRSAPAAQIDDVAVLMHTGGTTGVPKASMLTQRSIVSNMMQSRAWVTPLHDGSEVFYVILPLFHAYGFTIAMCSGILLGATLALFPKFDVDMVLDAQKRLPCTFFVGVAPMFSRLLAKAEQTNADLTSIQFTLSGAMPLSKELAAQWERATGGYMIEGYGMTESSPVAVGSPLSSARRPGTLGLPFPSTQVRIADQDNLDADVPEGEIGELLIRGPQVFKGYWNNPEETETAFHDGWLRTGDLVRVEDGFIVMSDRKKELIISGGFNVFPSQVEDAVRGMPGVDDVAVVGLPEAQRGEEVVAALILEAGATVTLDDVRKWAEKSLAHYALPRRIVVMSELPRSQIGKVMRRKVREYLEEAGGKLDFPSQDLVGQLREGAAVASTELKALSERLESQTKEAADRLREHVGNLTSPSTDEPKPKTESETKETKRD